MRGAAVVALTVLIGASTASAEVMVRVSGDQVAVRATAAPLADVLDRLARQTGMAIVYEGPPPRQPVTVAFDGRTPAEAVLSLLEGQGLNYALVADPTGRRVAKLVLSGSAGSGNLASRASTPAAARMPRPFSTLPPGASPEVPYTQPEQEPFEDAPFLPGEETPAEDPGDASETPTPEVSPAPGAPPPGLPAPPGAPVRANAPVQSGPVMAPGTQGQIFPVSPFTPQPYPAGPFPPAPPGTPGATPTQDNGTGDGSTSRP